MFAPVRSVLVGLCVFLWLVPAVEAQVGGRILNRIKSAAEDEIGRKAEALVRDGIRCAVGDVKCVEDARKQGKTPVMTDRDGEILKRANGMPITDPDEAAKLVAAHGPGAAERPGSGAWANYDFVPGDRVIFTEDFSRDRVGNFPRRFDLLAGNWEIVEWQGGRYPGWFTTEVVPLVAGKPTVARVYADWTKKATVNDWSQVIEFPARVPRQASQAVKPERASAGQRYALRRGCHMRMALSPFLEQASACDRVERRHQTQFTLK